LRPSSETNSRNPAGKMPALPKTFTIDKNKRRDRVSSVAPFCLF
jgi:hypothetical protein